MRTTILERVAEYRTTSRRIVSAPSSLKKRCQVLLELVAALADEDDEATREWCRQAIWEESRAFLGLGDPEPAGGPSDPWARKQRAIRAEGFSTCPRCAARIATDEELRRLSVSWVRWAQETSARERAVRDA